MEVKINVTTGNHPYSEPMKEDMQPMIDTIEKVINGKPLNGYEQIAMIDVKHILIGIQEDIRNKTGG